MLLRAADPATEWGAIEALTGEIERLDGYDPLTEEARLAVAAGTALDGIVAETGGRIAGYAHLRPEADATIVETAVPPAVRADLAAPLVDAALAGVTGPVRVWVSVPETVAVCRDRGLSEIRRMVHLIRSLPPDEATRVPRAFEISLFRPHLDIEGLLEVNNAAFAGHPDNASWTQSTVRDRMEREWFDVNGVFLARERGRVVGVCWTKLHPNQVGEIYVIAIHPEVQGRSLATGLVLTGLWDLYQRCGARTAILYTEADNERARGLYERLGFEILRTRRCFAGIVGD